MQFSKHFWMVLVAALVAATPLQAAVVLHDDFNDGSLDTTKWSTFEHADPGAYIVEVDDVLKIRGYSSKRAFLATIGEWEPATEAITVSGRFLSNGTSHCDIWTRAANYFDTSIPSPWNGVADSGLRFGMSPNNLALEGFEKLPATVWTEFGTKAYLPTGGSDKTWDFVLTDDGLNVSFTVTEVDDEGNLTDNTATFAATSTLSEADKFHVLFTGHDIDLDYVTISVGGGGEPIPGDANDDGIVNDEDASILAAHWQMTGMTWGDGDFNDDQIVNDFDASILAANWQSTGEEVASVPEPAMLVLLAGGLVTLLLWRRK